MVRLGIGRRVLMQTGFEILELAASTQPHLRKHVFARILDLGQIYLEEGVTPGVLQAKESCYADLVAMRLFNESPRLDCWNWDLAHRIFRIYLDVLNDVTDNFHELALVRTVVCSHWREGSPDWRSSMGALNRSMASIIRARVAFDELDVRAGGR